MLQRSPSVYFFSHVFNAASSSLSKRDSPFSLAQTTTVDGRSVNASTSSLAWVVTTSCVRSDAPNEQVGNVRHHVRV